MTEVTKQDLNDKIKLTYLLIGIFLLVVLNITTDILENAPFFKVLFNLLIQVCILSLVAYTTHIIWIKFAMEQQEKLSISKDLEAAKQQAKVWEMRSREFITEFKNFIGQELENWGLSKSEKEIALLILQGKSSKEIAQFRFTSERTVRNQCRAIYEKSALSGKNEFMAYFLGRLIKD